jgi:hypothetical protein
MPDEHIPDHSGTIQTVPEDVFEEGPDEDEAAEFRERDHARKRSDWATWLADPRNDLKTLIAARRLEIASRPPRVQSNYVALPEKVFIPTDRKIRSVYASPSQVDSLPTHERVEVAIDRDDYDLGPTEYFTGYPDPSYKTLTDQEKVQRWADTLATVDYQGNRAKEINRLKAERAAMLNGSGQSRCLDALKIPGFKTYTKSKWALVAVLIGASVAIGTAVGLTRGRKLRITVRWAAHGKSAVVVGWDAFDAGTDDGAVYAVSLINADGTSILAIKTTDRSGRTVEFTELADGTYTVRVELIRSGEILGVAETTVVVASPTATPKAVPDPPTGVTVTVSPKAPLAVAGLTVTWVPAATGDLASSYVVSLAGVTPVVGAMTMTTALTSASFPVTTAGSYQATVVARNAAGDSTAVMSAVFSFSPNSVAPDSPSNVRAMPYKSKSGKAALLVRWDPPTAGVEVTGYRIRITGPTKKDPVITGVTQSTAISDLDDGTYSFSVASIGPGGLESSPPQAGTPVALTAAKIDPDTIEWDVVFSPTDIAKWKAANDQMSAADETTFWATVIAAVEDKANDYGGPADYSEQLALAKVLVAWIPLPAGVPDNAVLNDLADRLVGVTTPPFPKQGPAMGQAEYSDRVALWRAASTLQNRLGTADEVRRYKLMAVLRALDRYLAPLPTHDRLYENDVVPPETRPLNGTLAMQTAQRVDVLVNGVVNGVWWYRIAQDTGTNTVSVWRAGVLLAEASGDPGRTGWVSISFGTPVPVAQGDQLIVGVYRPKGAFGYGVRENGLTAGPRFSTLGHLRLPKSAPPGAGNGLYDYFITQATLPTTTYLDSEYFVTPDFTAT